MSDLDAGTPLLVSRNGAVARLTLNRPHARNAIDAELAAALIDAVQSCADARVIILDAVGAAFCAGLDLHEVRQGRFPSTQGIHALAASPAFVIGAVAGPAFAAGLDLALACDLIVAGPGATFVDRHLAMGLRPPSTVIDTLVARLGRRRAALMLIDDRPIDAVSAFALGLVDAVVDDAGEGLEATVARLAQSVATADAELYSEVASAIAAAPSA